MLYVHCTSTCMSMRIKVIYGQIGNRSIGQEEEKEEREEREGVKRGRRRMMTDERIDKVSI